MSEVYNEMELYRKLTWNIGMGKSELLLSELKQRMGAKQDTSPTFIELEGGGGWPGLLQVQ